MKLILSKIKFLEEEISKLKSENNQLKFAFEQQIIEWKDKEEAIRKENNAARQKLTLEKDEIIFVLLI